MTNSRAARHKHNPPAGRPEPAADPLVPPGDPGVGGLLADPEATVVPKRRGRPAGSASPDPEPPRAHGDWLPTHKSSDASGD